MNNMLRLMLLVLGLTSALSHAEITIEITQGADNATPIAVVPFAGAVVDDNIGIIIANDLKNSGQFKLLPEASLPSRPSSSADVFMSEWRPTGSDYLVVGSARLNSLGQYDIRYELFSIAGGNRIAGESLMVPANRWRDAAHQISDRIYQKITGIRGAFATKIIYVNKYTNEQGKRRYRLEMADSDGHRPMNVLDSHEPVLSPSWSPDGTRVAYVSFESGRPAIYIQNLATRERERITSFSGLNGAPAWSPDGRQLAMTLSKDGNPEIYVMNIESRVLRRITNHYAIDTEARWFPDGKSLIFTSDRGGTPQLYKVDINSLAVSRVTFEGNYNARAELSPDGKMVAFVHREKGQQFQIAVQELATGIQSIVTGTALDESPSFAPNGSLLVYATRRGSTGILSLVSPEGRVKVQLPARRGEVKEPAWSPFLR